MAARVTPGDVRAIITLDDSVVLYPFIQAAATLVDATLSTSGLATAVLFEIERWLAAHFAALSSPGYTEVGSGVYRIKLETPKLGDGLKGTRYGQVALSMDTSGFLARSTQGVTPTTFDAL
jgi:hypothetical protein